VLTIRVFDGCFEGKSCKLWRSLRGQDSLRIPFFRDGTYYNVTPSLNSTPPSNLGGLGGADGAEPYAGGEILLVIKAVAEQDAGRRSGVVKS